MKGRLNMPNLSTFFSIGYYKNYNFQRLMRNWNLYLQSDEPSEEVLTEWEEFLLKDFLEGAREWLKRNKDMIHWKMGLE